MKFYCHLIVNIHTLLLFKFSTTMNCLSIYKDAKKEFKRSTRGAWKDLLRTINTTLMNEL